MPRSPAPSESTSEDSGGSWPRRTARSLVRVLDGVRTRVERTGYVRAADVICGMALSYLVIAAVLRLIWLVRPDPFGNPFLEHWNRFYLQAVAFDAMQAGWLVLPPLLILLVFVLLRRGRGIPPRAETVARALFGVFVFAVLVVGIFDQEFMRFMGIHFSLAQLDTYGNSAAMTRVPELIADDRGGPGLGFLLIAASLIGSFLWMRAICRRAGRRPWRMSLGLCTVLVVSYAGIHFVHHSWIYHWRLATPLDLARLEWKLRTRPQLKPAEVAQYADAHQTRWWRMNGVPMLAGAGAPAPTRASVHRFPFSRYPLLHVTEHRQCVLEAAGQRIDGMNVDCARDGDNDGVPLRLDCDDQDQAVKPGAVDVPRNGLDEDCSGADAEPPNVLLLVLESHRAMNVGHLAGKAIEPPVTPRLDQLAAEGVAFARASANGLPTIASFMTIHTSLLPHPDQVVGATYTMDAIRSLPQTLRAHGYRTQFFSSVDPSYDNQTIWLGKWYDGVDFSPKRSKDAPLFEHVSSWLRDPARDRSKPFLVTVMTATNHYPFNAIEGVDPPSKNTLETRMQATMRYVDRAMGQLIDDLRGESFWDNTVVIVTGDHGFPLGEHGSYRITETAHVEAVAVPLVFVGAHPELKRIKTGLRQEPVSHLDIAPTVLDLAGIEPSGSWMGRSLLGPGEGQSLIVTLLGWSNERHARRAMVDPRSYPKAGLALYDRDADFAEQRALPLEGAELEQGRALATEVAEAAQLMRFLYEKDRLWPRWLAD